MIVRLGALLWELALSAVFLVVLVSCAISGAKKRKWAMVVVPVALVGILGVGNLLFYLAWPEVSRRAWDDYLEPFHYVIDLLR